MPKLLSIRSAIGEVRYPPDVRFLDKRGAIGYALGKTSQLMLLQPDENEVRLVDDGNDPRVRVGHSTAWFNLAADDSGVPPEVFTSAARQIWDVVEEHLEVEEIQRAGFRSTSILLTPTVDEAVQAFRECFFDYSNDPALQLGGKAVEVQSHIRAEAVNEIPGARFDAVIRVIPIHVLDDMAEALAVSNEEWGGAWAIDLDVYAMTPERETVPALFVELYTTALRILEGLAARVGDSADVASA